MLKIDKLTKAYGRNKVLNKLSGSFPNSGVIGILGPNGCGKTTLLKAITNLVIPSEGKISLNGKILNPYKDISFIVDQDNFYPLKMNELRDLFSLLFKDFDSGKFDEIINSFHLSKNELIKNLSKGHKACVNFALTASRNVPIYVLDEPFDSIDITIRDMIIDGIIQYINTEEHLLLISSHEIKDIERFIDHFALIEDKQMGELITIDTLRQTENMSLSEYLLKIWGGYDEHL